VRVEDAYGRHRRDCCHLVTLPMTEARGLKEIEQSSRSTVRG
jgi:hypothetical protein